MKKVILTLVGAALAIGSALNAQEIKPLSLIHI